VMDRITVNPRQMGGVPCIPGLRITRAIGGRPLGPADSDGSSWLRTQQGVA
jgi:hypothetical protein